jgi:dolichol-phosphate mannosyltransferase
MAEILTGPPGSGKARFGSYIDRGVLVVDDASPDGTGEYLRSLAATEGRLSLIARKRKLGLGTAYAAGFARFLAGEYESAIRMDADLSHDPASIGPLLAAAEGHDLVIGSRYARGARARRWQPWRRAFSRAANLYARAVTGLGIGDLTSGFKCWRRSALESIDLPSLRSRGYAFQMEATFAAWESGLSIVESPIAFRGRASGVSKISGRIVLEAAAMAWRLRLRRSRGRRPEPPSKNVFAPRRIRQYISDRTGIGGGT